MHIAKKIAYILVIIGALNWGVVGATGGAYDAVKLVFGIFPMIANIIYTLVGLSGLFLLFKKHYCCACSCVECNTCVSDCKTCEEKSSSTKTEEKKETPATEEVKTTE